MKRLLAPVFSLALIFSLSPIHTLIQAEENTKETNVTTLEQPAKTPEKTPAPETKDQVSAVEEKQNPTENEDKETTNNQTHQPPTNENNPSNPTPVTETKMEINRKLNDAGYAIQASLKEAKTAEGTWTFYVDGKKKSTKNNKKTSVSFVLAMDEDLEKYGEIKGHNIKIVFNGKIDGDDKKAEGTHSIPDLQFDYTQIGNNDKFTGLLKPASEAVGDWGIAVADENGEKIIAEKDAQNFQGTTFTHTFMGIQKGTYLVYIAFEGKVDGEETAIIKFLTLEVTEEGNGGGIKPPPTDYKPTKPVDKGTVDQVINNSKKGGPMPKTATSNPTGMFAGMALLAIGSAVLVYRRLVK
jgi:hypothetical protein